MAVVEVNTVLHYTMPIGFHRTKNTKKPPQQERKIVSTFQRTRYSFHAGSTKTIVSGVQTTQTPTQILSFPRLQISTSHFAEVF